MPTVSVWVDPDLSDFSDKEIEDEYMDRFGSNELYIVCDQIVQYIRCGELRIEGKGADILTESLFECANKIV